MHNMKVDEITSSESGVVSVESSLGSAPVSGSGYASPEKQDDDLVHWCGPDDHENPHNWPIHKMWTHVVLVALLALAT